LHERGLLTLSSQEYWENRYASGGNSGAGSEGANAIWKATVLNDFVATHHVRDVLEYGCGDGRQLELAEYPEYTGLDVSATAIRMCAERFPHHDFHSLPLPWPVSADLVLSLDVIYHLTEDDVFEQHMGDVFGSALHWVILYTTDSDRIDPDFKPADHVRHWPVALYVQSNFPAWELGDILMNPAPHMGGCDFYIYSRA
jgi:SAM-dependent methyltransferase